MRICDCLIWRLATFANMTRPQECRSLGALHVRLVSRAFGVAVGVNVHDARVLRILSLPADARTYGVGLMA
jgi:hypothetical protein